PDPLRRPSHVQPVPTRRSSDLPQATAIVSRTLETIMTWLNLLIRKAHLHHFLDNDNFIRLDLKQPTPVWIADPQRLPTYPESVLDRKSTRLNSSHVNISYAVFC